MCVEDRFEDILSEPPVPAPVAPKHPDAWYTPDVRAQYEPIAGVVTTIRETDGEFVYESRSPPLSPDDEAALEVVREHFSAIRHRRPLTREGVIERADRGFEPKYERALDRLLETSHAARRRIDHHALSELRLLGELTPLAVDDRIEVADIGDADELVVHTVSFAPVKTDVGVEAAYVDRVAGERLHRYTVPFAGFSVDVVVYRERLLGSDQFEIKYAVLEPDLLPGDEALIEACKARIWETNVDRVLEDREAFVADRARRFLSRRLLARNTRAWLEATRYRVRSALAEYDLTVPPVDSRYARDRLDDLVYYVLRDYVGEGILTVPIRDPNLEDIEANRVDERIKVVPRTTVFEGTDGAGDRVPTNLAFTSERAFVNVVTQLAASDGTELNASRPSAKVNLDVDGVEETIRCAVALPVISEGGPHVSIRKQSAETLTPVDLLEYDALSSELVTLLWLLYEYHGVVLFSGPTGVGKTTLMNAHMPFIPFDDRPISIDEGSREVHLPHETGVSLTTREHENEYKRVTMAELMTETNYLNPDVEVIAEINTPASFETFAEVLNTGHGVLGTTHAEDVETLINRVIERGLPAYLLRELDLVVFPHKVGGDRYVAHVVEILSDAEFEALEAEAVQGADRIDRRGGGGTIRKGEMRVHWNTVAWRDTDGEFRLEYDHPALEENSETNDGISAAGGIDRGSRTDGTLGFYVLHRLAERTDRDVHEIEDEFHRKHRYVQYLASEGIDDFEGLFEFLSDLRTDEAATVERAARTAGADE
ncbi:type II/IV secretion system ATPase subunit [Halopenitus sp. H-Gu1]|uniref:type II/IV secretion system ATPase subunit n=1 Tax=Halopenitus sp. H-Gu1 TaxID=3242697 RepID=UPI00359D6EE0